MRGRWVMVGLVIATGGAQAQSRSAFDGTWMTIVQCEALGSASGYRLQFGSVVRNGVLHGEYARPNERNSLTLDGAIQPDGTSLLRAQGITGSPRYNLDNFAQGQPYQYTLNTRFDAKRGVGRRQEMRPCTATFDRQ